MTKTSDKVHVLMDELQTKYSELSKVLPEAIKDAQCKVDEATNELLQLQAMQQSLPTSELAAVAAKPERRKKVAKAAKKKATKLRSLSSQLKELRVKAEKSQAQVARESQIAQSTLCQIERGFKTPSDLHLKRLAKTYGVPVDSFKKPEGALPN